MRGGKDDSAKGAAMKLVQWPDNFPDLTDATPNLPALRRILWALAAAAVLCFAICAVLVVHDGPVKRQPARAISPACRCSGQCMRPR
jgi:hypothetical protein